jgi:hypothetical protein
VGGEGGERLEVGWDWEVGRESWSEGPHPSAYNTSFALLRPGFYTSMCSRFCSCFFQPSAYFDYFEIHLFSAPTKRLMQAMESCSPRAYRTCVPPWVRTWHIAVGTHLHVRTAHAVQLGTRLMFLTLYISRCTIMLRGQGCESEPDS